MGSTVPSNDKLGLAVRGKACHFVSAGAIPAQPT